MVSVSKNVVGSVHRKVKERFQRNLSLDSNRILSDMRQPIGPNNLSGNKNSVICFDFGKLKLDTPDQNGKFRYL